MSNMCMKILNNGKNTCPLVLMLILAYLTNSFTPIVVLKQLNEIVENML